MARRKSRRRSRGGSPKAIVIIGIVVVGGLAAYLFGPQALQTWQNQSDSRADATDPRPAETLVAGVIVDPSGSNGGTRKARQALRLLADIMEQWPGTRPTTQGGTPATAGLDLTVRQISGNSFASNAQIAHVVIPPIPAVPERPLDTTNPEANEQFLIEVEQAQASWDQAFGSATQAAKQLTDAELSGDASEVAGAISSLAQVLPRSERPRRIVIVSDLLQAGASPQIAGDLTNTVVTAIQRCDKGAARCQEAQKSFTRLVTQLSGPAPTYVRIEALDSALAAALTP